MAQGYKKVKILREHTKKEKKDLLVEQELPHQLSNSTINSKAFI